MSQDPVGLADLLLGAAVQHPTCEVRYVADKNGAGFVAQPYPELLAAARRALGGLHGLGLRPGQPVALCLERPAELLPAFWACVLGGYVPCPLLPLRTDPQRWAAQLGHVAELLDGPLVITAGELPPVPGLVTARLEQLAASAPAPAPAAHRARPGDLALLMLTSGSTGNPKAVTLTHGNLLAALAAKNQCLQVTAEDVTLNWISFDHVAALEMHLLPMLAGATQVHAAPGQVLSDPMQFLRLVDEHRVSVTFSPNFLLGEITRALPSKRGAGAPDLSSVRHIISGGEAVVVATARKFLADLAPYGLAGNAIRPAFGMTETFAGSVCSTEFPAADAGAEFASLGLPMAGLEIRCVDGDDRPLGDSREGDFQLRGPMVTAGYLHNEAATKAAFTPDGWFRTGDRGRINAGRVTLVGRSKDSIIVNGVNYFSNDLETVLNRLAAVVPDSVAAFAIRPPGSDTEQLAVLFATDLAPDDEAGLHRLIMAVRNGAILHWGFRPAVILPLPPDLIPRTSLGKIQRTLLRTRLEAGEFTQWERRVDELVVRQLGGFTAPRGATEQALTAIYAELFALAVETVSATASFFDIGGTSLDIIRLKHAVEERFDLADLPVTRIFAAPTVRGLAELLDAGDRSGPAAYDPVVVLQRTGAKAPLFCVHPGIGEVLLYVSLAKYFTHDRPFYALRARGFGAGERFFDSVEEMVESYVRAIRARQPHGPYAVAGYSYGGVVAFEIAKVLEAAGERVDFIGIISQTPHISARMRGTTFMDRAASLAQFLGLISKDQADRLPTEVPADLPRAEQLRHLLDLASPTRLTELDLDAAALANWANLAHSLVEMGRDYEPSGKVRSLSVFSEIPPEGVPEMWRDSEVRAWDEFTERPNRYLGLTGEHDALMGPRYVEEFQALLRSEVDRAMAEVTAEAEAEPGAETEPGAESQAEAGTRVSA